MTDPSSNLPPFQAILETVLRNAPEYLVILDPELRIVAAGETFRRAVGMKEDGTPSFLDTIERFSLSKTREVFEELRQKEGTHLSLDVNHRRADGEPLAVSYSWISWVDETGTCRAFVGIGREQVEPAVSSEEVARLEEELVRLRADRERRAKEIARLRHKLENRTLRDETTGLHNRPAVLERLEGELDRAQRYDEPLTLVLCDIDHMNRINERHGQEKGDEVIQAVARVVREQVRKSDVASRYAGEEFLILCPHTDRANAQFLAERLRRRIAELSFQGKDDEEFGITVSVGLVAVNGQNEFGVEAVLRAVELALESAKTAGMNRVSLVDVG